MTTYRKHKGNKCNPYDLILIGEGVQCSRCSVMVTQHTTELNIAPTKQQRIERLISYGFEFEKGPVE